MTHSGSASNSRYAIALEVGGPLGMFADHTSGSDAVSHPLPTPSTCEGIINSIIRVMGVSIHIVAVGTCRMPSWTQYKYNSHTPLRKSDLVKSGSALQTKETVLLEPRFQILGYLTNKLSQTGVPERYKGINCAHSMQEQFFKRLKRGQNFTPTALGRKEFLADYVGPQITAIEHSFQTVIPSMSNRFFGSDGVDCTYLQNVRVNAGVIHFDHSVPYVMSPEGMLQFHELALQQQITKGRYRHAQSA